ncbi:hypothetical protein BVRB_037330, partial [Beta vulgaris subsp. vulgaris]
WTRLTRAPADIQSFIQSMQNRYGLEFVSPPAKFLSPQILVDVDSTIPLLYGYPFAWRTARSAQEWVKANGGLCRKTGEQIRSDALSKGLSVPYEDMIELFYNDHQNVTLHEDLRGLSIRLSPVRS